MDKDMDKADSISKHTGQQAPVYTTSNKSTQGNQDPGMQSNTFISTYTQACFSYNTVFPLARFLAPCKAQLHSVTLVFALDST